jgi:hypothetical protein
LLLLKAAGMRKAHARRMAAEPGVTANTEACRGAETTG